MSGKPVWESSSNAEILVNFNAELAKDVASVGSWKDDFGALADNFKLLRCPYFTSAAIETGFHSFRMSNCTVDDANWKVALLACATTGNCVKEIVIQNCALEPSQINDLVAFTEKTGSIVSLKLEYISFNSNKLSEYQEILKALFTINNPIEYISLRGNKLGDSFISNVFTSVLPSSIFLRALNISDNCLSEEGLSSVLSSIRLNTSLELVNASNNKIAKLDADSLIQVLFGSTVTPDDDNIIKALAGKVADKNKALKDINKKRKGNKPPLPEIPDLVLKPNQILKVTAPVGPVNKVVNTALSLLDLSGNPLDGAAVEASFSKIREAISGCDQAIMQVYQAASADPNRKRFTFLLQNVAFKSHFDQSIHETIEVINS